MFNKNKNNPQVSQEQLAQCHTNFITLRRKCNVMLEKEVSLARYLAENNRRSKECEQRIKTLYYLIGMIDDGVDRLYQIHSLNELNSTFNELDTTFKQLNKLSAGEKIDVKPIQKPAVPAMRTDIAAQGNAEEYKAKSIPRSGNLQPYKQPDKVKSSKPEADDVPIDVNEELDQINMYLEGFFED